MRQTQSYYNTTSPVIMTFSLSFYYLSDVCVNSGTISKILTTHIHSTDKRSKQPFSLPVYVKKDIDKMENNKLFYDKLLLFFSTAPEKKARPFSP